MAQKLNLLSKAFDIKYQLNYILYKLQFKFNFSNSDINSQVIKYTTVSV